MELAFGTAVSGELQARVPVLSVGGIADIFVIFGLELLVSYRTIAFKSTAIIDPTKERKPSVKLVIVAYIGIGAGADLGVFSVDAFVAFGIAFEWDVIKGKVKLGGLAKVEIEVDLTVVSVNISGELRGVVYEEDGTKYCDASGTVALNVSILVTTRPH